MLEPDAAAPGVLAPLVLVTGVSGTGIVVVTILCVGTRSTGAVGTDVSHGALVAIVASRRIVTVDAAEVRIAAVVSAEFIVVAIEGNRACLAATVGTEIPDGAGIFIIARTVSGSICAARFTIATVFGADVAIIAIHCRAASAKTVGAEVVAGTSITVVASDIEELILALPAFTGIGRAGILIIAIHQETSHAFAIATRIIQSTGITIVTGPSRGEVQTTSLRRAGILRTRIIIVAILQLTSHALASLAGITKSTSIAVVALSVRGQILAPNC